MVNIAYAQMLAQIKQGRPQFDVIDTSMADVVRFKDEDATEAARLRPAEEHQERGHRRTS